MVKKRCLLYTLERKKFIKGDELPGDPVSSGFGQDEQLRLQLGPLQPLRRGEPEQTLPRLWVCQRALG